MHALLDGRDVPPQSALTYLKDLESFMSDINCGKIATVSGRYYGMDRDIGGTVRNSPIMLLSMVLVIRPILRVTPLHNPILMV